MFNFKSLKMKSLFFILGGLLLFSNVSAQTHSAVYYGGTIITMEGESPQYVEAIVSKEDKIVFVGKKADAFAKYPKAVKKDLMGKTLLPGFIDPHIHPVVGGMILQMEFIAPYEWDFPWKKYPAITNRKDLIKAIVEANNKLKDKSQTLFLWGYQGAIQGNCDRKTLDSIAPNRAVVMLQFSQHEAFLNTVAIQKYGLDNASTQKDTQIDLPTGKFMESGFFGQVMSKITPELLSEKAMADNFDKLRKLAQMGGVTTMGDMATGTTGQVEPEVKMMQNAYENDNTPFRIKLVPDLKALGYAVNFDYDKLLPIVLNMKKYNSKHFINDNTIKLFADGAFFAQNMMVLPPGYNDGHIGEWIMTPEVLKEGIEYWWKKGYNIHIHCNGSGGLEEILKTAEKMKAAYPNSNLRLSIEHFGQSDSNQMPRLKKVGGMVSANMYYLYSMSDVYAQSDVLGKERASEFDRIGSAKKSGVPFTFHSDFNMAPLNPLLFVWIAVNRLTVNGNEMAPEEKITAYQALQGITSGGAYNLHLEKMIGTLKVGKKADYVILEENPLTVNSLKIKDIKVVGTVFEGKAFSFKK